MLSKRILGDILLGDVYCFITFLLFSLYNGVATKMEGWKLIIQWTSFNSLIPQLSIGRKLPPVQWWK